jgi:hypothetical protein
MRLSQKRLTFREEGLFSDIAGAKTIGFRGFVGGLSLVEFEGLPEIH